MNEPTRPLVRWHGGKWMLAPWIISHFPPHRVYVEPFGGGGSVLLRKPRSYAEVYNDLDGEIVNLFRVARDQGPELAYVVTLTPFARQEFQGSYEPSDDPLEQARRTVVRSFMGYGSNAHCQNTGFRANSNRSGNTPARDWNNWPDALRLIIERLQGIVIENRDAAEVMLAHDSMETLHYVDPPYVSETRSTTHGYRHELTDPDHETLAAVLRRLQGCVILSGYPCRLYDRLYKGWVRVDRPALADHSKPRTECLWFSRAPSHDLLGWATA